MSPAGEGDVEEPRDETMVGRVIAGKYLLESVLGDGSCGTVYRAKQRALGKDVAVKVLHRAMSSDAAIVERFHREARAASQLGHPNSIAVYDFGQEPDGLLYLVMEYVAGRDLFTVMNEEGPLDAQRIVRIVGQVLAALAVAHDHGIVHRDLKPENILIVSGYDDDGECIDRVKVCDFGIATLASADDPTAIRLTAHGCVVGTPEYMAPEQALGHAVDGRTDLYALGAMLYQLLTGRVPFSAETPVKTALAQIHEPVIPPSQLQPRVDAMLERVALRALAKNPADRYENARKMRAALRGELPSLRPAAVTASVTVPPTRPRPRSARVAAAVGAVGVLLAAALGAFGERHRPKLEGAAAAAVVESTSVSDKREEAATVEGPRVVYVMVSASAAPPASAPPASAPPARVKPHAKTVAPAPAESAFERPPHVVDDGF